ncbi:MAG: DUF2207 domain-containing protein [Gemmatimonadaceae bacterium]
MKPGLVRVGRALLVVFALGLALSRPLEAQGTAIRIRDFDALLTVQPDGATNVVETLTIGFTGEWHGINRALSLHHNTAQGRATKLAIDNVDVTDSDGTPLRVERQSLDNGWTLGLKIYIPGAIDANRTVVIRYRVRNAIRFFFADSKSGALDELYWNVTGNSWTMPIDEAHARVVLPTGVIPTQTAVYTGSAGSKAGDATIVKSGNEVSFTLNHPLSAYQGMTIAVGWPPGHISSRPSESTERLLAIVRYWPVVIPFLIGLFAYRAWNARGRDPEELSFVVHYEPIAKLSPAEAGTLIDNDAGMEDITATLVDLAVRGYVRIEETTEKHLLGLTSSTDYIFHILKPSTQWSDLAPHEQRYMDGLAAAAPLDETTVKLSDLRNKFYKSLRGIRDAIYDALVAKGYYLTRPDKVKSTWTVMGMFCLIGGFFLTITGAARGWVTTAPVAIGFAAAASAAALIFFGWIMPARTIAGARAREATLGFKEFLGRVESERYRQMITSPDLFERYLPYAMAFGVADEWAHAFEGMLTEPPTWYVGGTGPFSPINFSSQMSTFSTAASSSMASSPSSSGSGGGGSSGGGSGGGGGSGF